MIDLKRIGNLERQFMSGGPFRVPQSGDRRTVSVPEPTALPPEVPQPESVRAEPVATMSEAVAQPTRRITEEKRQVKKDKKSLKRFKLPIIAGIITFLVVIGLILTLSPKNSDTAIDADKYQAVFFTNGQVYFGKLHSLNATYLKLTDVYYLQTQATGEADSTQKTTDTKQNIIKLGDEIHGPEYEMIISRDQVLFYENLKTDGKVAQSIAQTKKP